MKYLSEIITVVIASTCAIIIITYSCTRSKPVEPQKNASIKLMSFNIHQGFDNFGKVNPQLFLKIIQKFNPDIISLQESETNRITSANFDIVLWLVRKLNMFYYYGPKTKDQIYGVSILSRYPMKKSTTTPLKSVADQRVLVESIVTINGRDVTVLAVHLGLSVEDRFNQTRWIYEEKIKKGGLPIILMGDFNTNDWEDFISYNEPIFHHEGWQAKQIKAYWQLLQEQKKKGISNLAKKFNYRGLKDYNAYVYDTWRLKHPNDHTAYTWWDTKILEGKPKEELQPSVRIDYIFVSKDFNVIDSKIVEDKDIMDASDHLPVVSTVQLK